MTMTDAPHQPALRLGLRRPGRTDPIVEADAIATFSVDLAKLDHEDLGKDAAGIAEALRALSPIGTATGGELAQRLLHWSLADAEMDVVEALDEWSAHLSRAHDVHVARWVVEQGIEPPFRDVARVSVVRQGTAQSGAAYLEARGAPLGRCLFVPDADRVRFVREGAFAGGWVVDWEDLGQVASPEPLDLDGYRLKTEDDARQAKRKAEPYVSMDLGSAYRAAMRLASRSTAETLRIDAAASVAALAARGEEIDATSPEAVALVAALVTLSRAPASR